MNGRPARWRTWIGAHVGDLVGAAILAWTLYVVGVATGLWGSGLTRAQ